MSSHPLNISHDPVAQSASYRGQPISHILIDQGVVAPRVMVGALAEAARVDQPVSRVIETEALASREAVLGAQSHHFGALALRRDETPPDRSLITLLSADFCLQHGVLPWMKLGGTLVLATSRPDHFETVLKALPRDLGPVSMALTLEADIHAEIADRHGEALVKASENQLPAEASCRDLNQPSWKSRMLGLTAGLGCLVALATVPRLFFACALALALLSLLASQIMKLAALIASHRQNADADAHLGPKPPLVSIMVPLYQEHDIAKTLVRRLSRLTYPKSRLDVVLVLEALDETTRATLARTALPPWIRVITVPVGQITTKPRALNYAFRFTRGDIVGIFDAEDAPALNQIERVVDYFQRAPPNVGCLQGILDFYNPKANWLSRCFTIEYASWFRVMLPGLARLGFAVPLGGTTVFFRRHVLEEVGGWDAHNVTEDADLGIRLARFGYKTELVRTVTREEANNRMWPWVKQRSRWLKGYAITWWVHSRSPIRLWRDLGTWRFFGVQMLFLTTLLQFTLAPLLWSFWLVLAGLPHPLDPWLDKSVILALTVVFLSAEAVTILVGITALARSPHTGFFRWVPTLFAYFPLGSLAMYKALWETVTRPFFWDKTEHGHSAPDLPDSDIAKE